MSSELSDDPKMQELVQYVRRQSSDMAKEIDSVLTSTDESDEDSLKRARTSGTGDSRDPMDPVKERLRLLLIDRKAQKDVITAQKAEIQALRNASKSSSSGGRYAFACCCTLAHEVCFQFGTGCFAGRNQ